MRRSSYRQLDSCSTQEFGDLGASSTSASRLDCAERAELLEDLKRSKKMCLFEQQTRFSFVPTKSLPDW